MLLFSFGFTLAILSHVVVFKLEAHALYNWFSYDFAYDETINGFYLALELCKIRLFLCVGCNINDSDNLTCDTFWVRESHNKLTPEQLKRLEEMAKIEEEGDYNDQY